MDNLIVDNFKIQMALIFDNYTKNRPPGNGKITGMVDKLTWLENTIKDINETIGKLVLECSNGDNQLKEELHSLAVGRTKELITYINAND